MSLLPASPAYWYNPTCSTDLSICPKLTGNWKRPLDMTSTPKRLLHNLQLLSMGQTLHCHSTNTHTHRRLCNSAHSVSPTFVFADLLFHWPLRILCWSAKPVMYVTGLSSQCVWNCLCVCLCVVGVLTKQEEPLSRLPFFIFFALHSF